LLHCGHCVAAASISFVLCLHALSVIIVSGRDAMAALRGLYRGSAARGSRQHPSVTRTMGDGRGARGSRLHDRYPIMRRLTWGPRTRSGSARAAANLRSFSSRLVDSPAATPRAAKRPRLFSPQAVVERLRHPDKDTQGRTDGQRPAAFGRVGISSDSALFARSADRQPSLSLALPPGFEPGTFRLGSDCSIQLSYGSVNFRSGHG
jgi:hypothetical protein